MNNTTLTSFFLILTIFFCLAAGCSKMQQQPETSTNSGEEETPVTGTEEDVLIDPVGLYTIEQDTLVYCFDRDVVPNESHSDTWVQYASDGTVGMVYRESAPAAPAAAAESYTGKLVYKTVKPDGTIQAEVVTTDNGAEMSVLVYDSKLQPHVFTAWSTNSDQYIRHYSRTGNNQWTGREVFNFAGEGGKYLYEITALINSDDSFHLLVLIIPNNPMVRSTYYIAHIDSRLYYLSNKSGTWQKELVDRFDTLYIADEYCKPLTRQDMAMDTRGNIHTAYGALRGPSYNNRPNPSEMRYACNESGEWKTEVASEPWDVSCECGWNPSIAVDNDDRPHIAFTLIDRVVSLSAANSKMRYSSRTDEGTWQEKTISDTANNFYGNDNGKFTGAIPHLVFDSDNHPHLLYADIASSHYGSMGNTFNVGQIRYAYHNGTAWERKIFYRQESPASYNRVNEILGLCMVISPDGSKIRIIAQEFISNGTKDTYNLLLFSVK